jgi:CYTH domain-containing protein
MNFTSLLKMLIELEQAIGVESETAIRIRIQDVENAVLNTQKERVERLRAGHGSFAT